MATREARRSCTHGQVGRQLLGGWRLHTTRSFFESIKTVFRKYAEFGGRATRPEFWWFDLFSSLVSAALDALTVPCSGRRFEFDSMVSSVSTYTKFASLWGIAILVRSLAVTVRRLGDSGREWSQLFWALLLIVGWMILIVRLTKPGITATAPPTEEPESDSAA